MISSFFSANLGDKMKYDDFYEIDAYGNEKLRGKFTPEEIACNAYDYLCEFERSKQDGQETNSIRTLMILLVSDGSDQCFEWAARIREEIKGFSN